MRKLLAGIVLAATVTAAHADPATLSLIGSGVSSVINVIRIALNGEPADQVTVVAYGTTDSAALDEAFKLAVSQAVGSVIATDTRAVDNRLVRNEIINYSSGYVSKYTITRRDITPSGVKLEVIVYVSSSKLANRLLGDSRTDAVVEGGRIGTNIKTYLDNKRQGDRLVEAVASDFPRRAFVIKATGNRVEMNADRSAALLINYEVEWDNNFKDSLSELFAKMDGTGPTTVRYHKTWGWVNNYTIDSNSYYYLMQYMDNRNSPLTIELNLLDRNNRVVYRTCNTVKSRPVWGTDYRQVNSLAIENLTVQGRWSESGVLGVVLTPNINVSRIDRTELIMTTSQECQRPH